jgi:hypothetical protein
MTKYVHHVPKMSPIPAVATTATVTDQPEAPWTTALMEAPGDAEGDDGRQVEQELQRRRRPMLFARIPARQPPATMRAARSWRRRP